MLWKNKNMQIVFIANANSIHTLRWISYFIKNKNEITLISIEKPNHTTIIEFNKLKKKVKVFYLNSFISIISAINFLINKNYSLVHIHYLGWHSLLSAFIKKSSKLILTPWGSDLLFNKNNVLKKFWLAKLFKRSDFLICDSKRLESESVFLGMNKDKTLISMFGVDTDIYKKSRRIFSMKKNFIVGSNRNHEDVYDIITLLNASKIICKMRDDVEFYLAGSGSLKQMHIDYVKKNNLDYKVRFLGLLNKEEMLKFYNDIDIYVSTSLSDGGLSASIAESMAFERLNIISNNSDNKKWVRNKSNGYLFRTSDYKELAKLIINSIKDKENSLKIAERSRQIIVKRYSYKNEMMKVEQKYMEICSNIS